MKLDDIVSWYQKKIGTYDKEPWEKTVEEKIFDGFTNSVTLKTAKLKTELIDVDLVRGSTFPKAKPKQSLLTVICLAVLRYIFFPLYAKWWVRQTTPIAFILLFLLYILQMINWAIYALYQNLNVNNEKSDCSSLLLNSINTLNSTLSKRSVKGNNDSDISEHIISISELLIPMTLSFLLTFIHSQIVATKIIQNSCKTTKRRRFGSSTPNLQNRSGKENQRQRRRKKVTRQRSHELFNVYPIEIITQLKGIAAKVLPLHSEVCSSSTADAGGRTGQLLNSFVVKRKNSIEFQTNNIQESTTLQTNNDDNEKLIGGNVLDNGNDADFSYYHNKQDNNECSVRRRNVNWHSPIHNYVSAGVEISHRQEPVISGSILNSSNSLRDPSSKLAFNSSSSASSHKTVRIDECVEEFYDELLDYSTMTIIPEMNGKQLDSGIPSNRSNDEVLHQQGHRTVGEDDGFESLNGKSSSGEETLGSILPQLTKHQVLSRSIPDNDIQNGIEDLPKCSLSAACVNVSSSASTVNTTELACHLNKGFRSSSVSSDDTEEDGDDGDGGLVNSADCEVNAFNYNECTTSATDWMGITTNSEDCSYSSDIDNSDSYQGNPYFDELNADFDSTPTTILNPYGTSDRISCTIWDRHEIKKAQMSVLDIASCIIENVESMPKINDYVYMGVFFAFLLSFIPCFYRLCEITFDTDKTNDVKFIDMPSILWEKASFSFLTILHFAFGQTKWERTILVLGFLQRLMLTLILFMIFAVAERTFKQRFLYAKLFSHLTSSRRARKSNLPHFRLNKVRNIKTWLSVRSYLKKRGPQRSVDVIVSAAFMLTLLLLGFLSVEWLKDTVRVHSHLNLEALLWSTTIGIYVLRYITLGNKIQHKYRSVSVLITEQINLYLQIEKKPKKKEELMVSNSVLKLAADLLKELETPFKISGLSANPYLFTTIKVVILSALSGVLSEMLGFKLKLHKIKIK